MRRLLPLAAALVSGVATALALPLVVPFVSIRQVDPGGRLELVAWVALVPVLLALRGCRGAWPAARLGLVAGTAYFFAAIYWVSHAMTAFGGLSLAFALFALTLLVLYMAAHWALAFAVAARVRSRLGWPLWAVLPPVWVAAELLRNYLFSGFPWADLGYTQVRTLPVAQLASLAGVYGIAALVVLVNAALAEVAAALLERRARPLRAPATAAALLAIALAYGELHLRSVRAEVAAAPELRVGVVQPNIDQSTHNARRFHEEYILERLVPPTVEADRAGADLVVWPEAAYPFDVPPDIRTFDVRGSGIPLLSRAHLLAGAPTVEWLPPPAPGERKVPKVGNMLFLLAPDLQVLGPYQKLHLVPFGEYVPEAVRILLPFVKQLVPTMAAVSPGKSYTVLEFRRPPAVSGAALAADDPPDPAPAGRGHRPDRPAHLLRRHLPGDGPDLRPQGAGAESPGQQHQRRLVRLLLRPLPVPGHRPAAGHRGAADRGPLRLRRRLRGDPPHRRARPGRDRRGAGRSGPRPRPGRAPAPAPGPGAAVAGRDPLH